MILAVLAVAGAGWGDVPPTAISFQGKVTPVPMPVGTAYVGGTSGLTFKIYDALDATTALKTITRAVTTDAGGVFNTTLDAPALAFDKQYWVGVKVGTDAEMTPRQPLYAAPYAITAKNVYGGKVSAESGSFVGNVGIGTVESKAAYALDVYGQGQIIRIGNAAQQLLLYGGVNDGTPADYIVPQIQTRTADDLALGANKKEWMRITAGGKVGIGTTNPGKTLDVNGDINFANKLYHAGQEVPLGGGQWAAGTNAAADITNANTGNVGIGTPAPVAKLDVVGGARFWGTPTNFNNTEGGYIGWNMLHERWGETDFINNSVSGADAFAFMTSAQAGALAALGTGNNNTTVNPLMLIQANGNVGIGTADPGYLLDVADQIQLRNGPKGDGRIVFNEDGQAKAYIGMLDSSTVGIADYSGNSFSLDTDMGYINITAPDSGFALNVNGNINYTGDLYKNYQLVTSPWLVSGSDIYYSGGNVGIGTMAPIAPLSFASVLGEKLTLWGSTAGSSSYGFGIQSNQLQIHTDISASDILFGYGTSGNFKETMRIKGSGNVGIGTGNPQSALDINGPITTHNGQITFQNSVDTNGVTRPYLMNTWTSYYGDLLYLGATGGLSNTAHPAMVLAQNIGVMFGAGADSANVLSNEWGRFNSSGLSVGSGIQYGKLTVDDVAYPCVSLALGAPAQLWADWAVANAATNYSSFSSTGDVVLRADKGNLILTARDAGGVLFGTGATDSEKMRIANAGNVGIGTTSPADTLEVSGAPGSIRWSLKSEPANYYARSFISPGAGGTGNINDTYLGFQVHSWPIASNVAPATSLVLTGAGNVGIGTTATGTYKLYVNGQAYALNGWAGSDLRWKKNITPLENSLQKVCQLQGVNYEWRTKEFPDKGFTDAPQVGLIAQDVEKVIPQLVNTDKDGFKALDYSRLTAILVEAVKEQQEEIKGLKAENNALKNKMEAVENKLAK